MEDSSLGSQSPENMTGNFREVFNETSTETGKSQKTSNALDISRGGSLKIMSILALSTSRPTSDTLRPSTIPSLTIKIDWTPSGYFESMPRKNHSDRFRVQSGREPSAMNLSENSAKSFSS
ncbi:hypothetical protein Tco_0365009 [Tanacetum coccineum]